MHAILIICVVAVMTGAIRALPFILFPEGKRPPRFILTLSSLLPAAVMGMLVVYCLKGMTPLIFPYGLPELIAASVVVGSYIWKRNTLVSIIVGTGCYMLLVQYIFIY